MTTPKHVSGSFRDPSGRIFVQDDRIFRTVNECAIDNFSDVVNTGLLTDLVKSGALVDWEDVTSEATDLASMDRVVKVLEHPSLEMITYPYEWSFGALKAAALAHLEIQINAIDRNVVLSDATAYNIQFQGPRPVFIDHLSFRMYQDGEFWVGHRQFCEQFLNPLLLRARCGIPHNDWVRGNLEGISNLSMATVLPWFDRFKPRILTNVFMPAWFEGKKRKSTNAEVAKSIATRKMPVAGYRGMLCSLQNLIKSLNPPDVTTVWGDYADNTSYSTDETQKKRAMIAEFCGKLKPNIVWDIGCNTGEYSKVALENGAHNAFGFEFDSGALEQAYARAVKEELAFFPLFMDVANPSPSQGWNQAERDGLSERRNANSVIALAVIHHMCIGRNIPLEAAVSWLVGHAPTGLIEFVPKNDPMVIELLRLRDDVFDDYTNEHFDHCLLKTARIVKEETITEHGRRLVWYERK